ncbi:M24 family metallopeptidase, partial [bacterium]
MIPLKSDSEIRIMRQVGIILAEIMARVSGSLKAGMATMEIDMLAQELINKAGVNSAFKGYKGYPANVCVSVNQEVVHGIPGDKRLKEG